MPHWGTSNEYHNICFSGEITKIFSWYPILSGTMRTYLKSLYYYLTMSQKNLLEEWQHTDVAPDKRDIRKICFLFLHENTYCGYWLEAPHWSCVSEHMFLWGIKKTLNNFGKNKTCPKYTNDPPFGLCPYSNNIWMLKFQQLFFQMLNLMSYILNPSPTPGQGPEASLPESWMFR